MARVQAEVSDELREILDASGLEWSVESGSRHNKIKLRGRLILVLPREGRRQANWRAATNARLTVRRAIREEQARGA